MIVINANAAVLDFDARTAVRSVIISETAERSDCGGNSAVSMSKRRLNRVVFIVTFIFYGFCNLMRIGFFSCATVIRPIESRIDRCTCIIIIT